jgi:hypothetical protein
MCGAVATLTSQQLCQTQLSEAQTQLTFTCWQLQLDVTPLQVSEVTTFCPRIKLLLWHNFPNCTFHRQMDNWDSNSASAISSMILFKAAYQVVLSISKAHWKLISALIYGLQWFLSSRHASWRILLLGAHKWSPFHTRVSIGIFATCESEVVFFTDFPLAASFGESEELCFLAFFLLETTWRSGSDYKCRSAGKMQGYYCQHTPTRFMLGYVRWK